MKRFNVGLCLLLIAACAGTQGDAPPPEHIIGKYAFHEKGTFAKFPWDIGATLILERDAQYTLDLDVDIDGEEEHESHYGTYHVSGDKLVLDPAEGSSHGEFQEFTIAGNRLTPKLGWGARLALKGLKVNPVFVKAE
jgi:hypothetical protein